VGAARTDTQNWGSMPGPCTDYAVVISMRNGSPSWWDYWNVNDAGHTTRHYGPVRVAVHQETGNSPQTWSPRDSFAYWSDGTSNQLVLGEKHLHISTLGQCERTDAGTNSTDGSVGGYQRHIRDCSYMGYGLARGYPAFQPIRRNASGTDSDPASWHVNPIRRPNEHGGDRCPDPNNAGHCHPSDIGFGSHHPGVCQFLIGDGAVRSFSVTTPARTLAMLGDTSDGNSVAIPTL